MDKKEQEMREEINSYNAKKDYYQILGVAKAATEAQIKKAYRMLALRFHPDKNQYQGAKDVFKKVSNAYSVLIDAQKKAHYDRFGAEQDRPRPQYQRHGHAGGEDFEYQQFDDLFRAFFGGMPMHGHNRRGNVYTYSFGGNRQERGAEAQGQQGGFNFYYIFIIFFVIYTIAPLFESRPSYSTYPSGEYKYKVRTSILGVEFYVNQRYFEQAKQQKYKRHAEMIIDREYISSLQKQCEASKREKRRLEEFAYRETPGQRRDYYISQAKATNLGSCRNLNSFRTDHEDYLRDLTYMR